MINQTQSLNQPQSLHINQIKNKFSELSEILNAHSLLDVEALKDIEQIQKDLDDLQENLSVDEFKASGIIPKMKHFLKMSKGLMKDAKLVLLDTPKVADKTNLLIQQLGDFVDKLF